MRIAISIAVGASLLASLAAASLAGPATQLNAPSINTASPDLVDGAGLPALAGIAWDERLEPGPNDRAITLNVTPLAIARVVGLGEAFGSEGGDSFDWLRRIAARVTVGGPLQKVERSNARRAWRPTNHVTSELKMILRGDSSQDGEVGHRTLVGLALAADNVATGYGLDRYGATLIAEREGRCALTANAGYRVVERFHAPSRIEETKLATGARWRVFESSAHPLELGVSGGCLIRQTGAVDWQDGARVDLPVTGALEVSFAARRSHRPELPGQDEMREVVSLAYDFDRPRR